MRCGALCRRVLPSSQKVSQRIFGANRIMIYGRGCTAPRAFLCGFSAVEIFYTYIIRPIIHIICAFTFTVAFGIQNTTTFAAYSKTHQCKWPNAGHKIG